MQLTQNRLERGFALGCQFPEHVLAVATGQRQGTADLLSTCLESRILFTEGGYGVFGLEECQPVEQQRVESVQRLGALGATAEVDLQQGLSGELIGRRSIQVVGPLLLAQGIQQTARMGGVEPGTEKVQGLGCALGQRFKAEK